MGDKDGGTKMGGQRWGTKRGEIYTKGERKKDKGRQGVERDKRGGRERQRGGKERETEGEHW